MAMCVKIGQKMQCKRCQHRWQTRGVVVFICPKCKSAKWNVASAPVSARKRKK